LPKGINLSDHLSDHQRDRVQFAEFQQRVIDVSWCVGRDSDKAARNALICGASARTDTQPGKQPFLRYRVPQLGQIGTLSATSDLTDSLE
jgi:hypothetical protein